MNAENPGRDFGSPYPDTLLILLAKSHGSDYVIYWTCNI